MKTALHQLFDFKGNGIVELAVEFIHKRSHAYRCGGVGIAQCVVGVHLIFGAFYIDACYAEPAKIFIHIFSVAQLFQDNIRRVVITLLKHVGQ